MLKHGLVFLAFLLLSSVIYFHGSKLFLYYFIFTPFLIFPVFYFYHVSNYRFLLLAGCFLVAICAVAIYRYFTLELLAMIFSSSVVFLALLAYRKFWTRLVHQETEKKDQSQSELDILKEKFNTRQESLLRLEKQVASLMGLFEIARDFNECLSFDLMAKLLKEKVMPELPFFRMRLVFVSRSEQAYDFNRQFVVTAGGWDEIAYQFSEEELALLKKVSETKEIHKPAFEPSEQEPETVGLGWIFPLVIDGDVSAIMTVEGAHQDDFVRFEVLISHLVLQVKKIKLYETVKELSIIDDLTRVYMRRHFLERFSEEVDRSLKFRLPFAVLMLDIDHFKIYNDEFGHLVGDATLREVARLLRENLRKVDIVARFGGEEFIAVLPETSAEAAVEVGERIRSSIARHRFNVYDVETQVTVSVGISLFPADIPEHKIQNHESDIGAALIRYADKALYRAKEEGRNRVYRYQDI